MVWDWVNTGCRSPLITPPEEFPPRGKQRVNLHYQNSCPPKVLLLTTRRPQHCNNGRKMVYHAARLSLLHSYCCSQRTQQRMLLFQTSTILYNTTFPKSLSIRTLTTLCLCAWLWEHCCSSVSNSVHSVGPAYSPAHPASSPEPRCPALVGNCTESISAATIPADC